MKRRTIIAADLFCGAGGLTAGLLEACEEMGYDIDLTAVNHWDVAISTHSRNHPRVKHFCETVEGVDPAVAVPGGILDLMIIAAECTHHSNARGGKPMSPQSRASIYHALRWCDSLYVKNILIENVREFMDWGPLYPPDHVVEKLRNRPIVEKKGLFFRRFIGDLRARGYTLQYRVLNCAHYGDATTRQRFFMMATRTDNPVDWPAPSHVSPNELGLYEEAKPWRTAREIIDWSLPGKSIYGRKKSLAPNTLNRIFTGLQKFCGVPFLVPNFGEAPGQSPRCHSIDQPLPTVTGHGAGALVQPFLVVFRNHGDGRSLDRPLPTVCTSAGHFGLCQPYLIVMEHFSEGQQGHGRRCKDLDVPLPTVTGKGQFGLCEPFLVKYYEGSDAASVDEPLPTVTANYEHLALVSPFLTEYHGSKNGEQRVRSVAEPIPTQDTSNRFGLVQPFLINYNGTGTAHSVDNPLDTVTTTDRFALIESGLLDKGDRLMWLDIRFRMLQPHELAAAHSFPSLYQFSGNRDDQVKQIGNSVPVKTGKALCLSILGKVGVAT